METVQDLWGDFCYGENVMVVGGGVDEEKRRGGQGGHDYRVGKGWGGGVTIEGAEIYRENFLGCYCDIVVME